MACQVKRMMTDAMHSGSSIARQIPDLPRWVETRAALLGGRCEVFGLREEHELSLVACVAHDHSIFVVGAPDASAVHAAVARTGESGELLAPIEQRERLTPLLPGWTYSRAILHLMTSTARLPATDQHTVGFMDPGKFREYAIPHELLEELEAVGNDSPIAAAFVDGRPVAFCYAGSITETLWDVSIDTLEEHRRQGHAGRCAAFMIRHMRSDGREPVWGSLEQNPASWRLARKIGFSPVDEMAVFERS